MISPGPWTTTPDENCGGGRNILDGDGHRIGHTAERGLPEVRLTPEDAKHNAELMACALAYATAVDEFLEWWDSPERYDEDIVSTIETMKAIGERHAPLPSPMTTRTPR